VPAITLKVLFVFIVLEHRRREVLHFNVTDQPTAAWTSQQIVEAFAEYDTSRYLLRDRDGVYGSDVRSRMAGAANRGNPHGGPQPLAESIPERLIGSIRRECLDHFIILNARHLKRTLASYFSYYHGSRTHLGLDKQCPSPRQVAVPGGLFKSRNLEGYTTAMNVSQREGLGADGIMANDR
jgi:hypothetical protein